MNPKQSIPLITISLIFFCLIFISGCHTDKSREQTTDSLNVNGETRSIDSLTDKPYKRTIWENLNGPYSGDIYSTLVLKNGYIFIGTNLDGIFLSKDNGMSWTCVLNTSWRVYDLGCSNNGSILARLGTRCIFSTDTGATWQSVRKGRDSIWANTYLSKLGSVIVQDKGGAMYHSGNCGNSWSTIKFPSGVGKLYNMGFGRNGEVITVTYDKKIICSKDDGRTWNNIGAEYPYVVQVAYALDNGKFFVIMGDGSIYLSEDNGKSWKLGGKENLSIAFLDVGGGHLFVCSKSKGVLESFDYGNTFSSLGLPNTYVHSLSCDADGNLIVGTWGSGIFRFNKANKQWTLLTTGWAPTDVQCVAFDDTSIIYAGTSNFGVYKSTDAGGNWTNVSLSMADRNIQSIIVGHEDRVYTVSYTGYIYQSSDKGDTWTCLNIGGPGFGNINAQSLVSDSAGVLYAGCLDEGVMRLSVQDKKLVPLFDQYFRAEKLQYDISTNSFYCIVVDFEPISEDLHSGDRRLGTIHRSTDTCRTWKSLYPNEKGVECFAIDKSGIVYIGTEQSGVQRSTDHGRNWEKLGLKSATITSIAVCDSKTLIAATEDDSIYCTTDTGKTWTKVETGLPEQTSINFVSLGRNSYLYFGAWNGGLFKSVVSYADILRNK